VKGNQETPENEIAEYFEKEVFPKKKGLEDNGMYYKDIYKTTGALKQGNIT